MDGLMLDTEPGYRLAWSQATTECGYIMPDAVHSRLTGRTRADGKQVLVDEFGHQFPLDAFRVACERCESSVWAANPPRKKPGLDNLLGFLESKRVPKAVATSTDRLIAVP